MDIKIKFLENARKQSTVMPRDDIDGGSNDANKNTTKVPISFLSSFLQKVDLNKDVGDASTSNTIDNAKKNVPQHPKIYL